MKASNIKEFSKSILLINLIILTIVSIVLLIIGDYSWLIGYLLGSITSYITFLFHANSASKNTTTKQIVASAGLRTLLTALPLAICLFVSFINMFATFIGLLVIKVVILIFSFITSLKSSLKYRKGGNEIENESN